MVKKIAESYHLPYFTITPTFSICPKHGYLSGEHEFCPKCDEEDGYVEGQETQDIQLNKEEVKQWQEQDVKSSPESAVISDQS